MRRSICLFMVGRPVQSCAPPVLNLPGPGSTPRTAECTWFVSLSQVKRTNQKHKVGGMKKPPDQRVRYPIPN